MGDFWDKWQGPILALAGIILALIAVALTTGNAEAGPVCWQELNGMVRCGVRW